MCTAAAQRGGRSTLSAPKVCKPRPGSNANHSISRMCTKCAGRAAGERCGGNACSVTAQPQADIGMLRMCTVLPHDGVHDVAYRMLHITSSMLCALRVGCRCIAYAYATVDAAPCTDAVRHSCRVDLADGDDRLRFQRRYLRSIQERCSSRDCRSKVSLRDSMQQRGRWTLYICDAFC
jgi:hypothetical protein